MGKALNQPGEPSFPHHQGRQREDRPLAHSRNWREIVKDAKYEFRMARRELELADLKQRGVL